MTRIRTTDSARRKQTQETGNVNLRHIPEGVKASFKAYCSLRGFSMREVMEYLMKECYTRKRRLPAGLVVEEPAE
jgi:hypothetical protein